LQKELDYQEKSEGVVITLRVVLITTGIHIQFNNLQ